MAEMNVPQKGGKCKTQAPRIDLTPMVDLGFLLITFFMYTTTLANPRVMSLNMPSTEHADERQVVIEESVITIIPVKGHRVAYYEGALKNAAQLKACPAGRIRALLLDKKARVEALPGTYSAAAHNIYVLIKPDTSCQYGDVVQLLDEMMITGIQRYTMMDMDEADKMAVSRLRL